jgi:2-polyprenyl-3-methyl-5-hydroxy-6-metoxy-1,4-benzoquinol methylase
MNSGYGKGWNPAEHYKDIEIARKYDKERFSSIPGRIFNHLEKRLIRAAFADLPASSRIGDVPCGTGRLAEVLVEAGYDVVGIDISPAMLEVAREKIKPLGGRFDTVVSDARRLSDTGMSFDAVLCARVLMHYPLAEQIEFLRDVAAVSKKRVVFTQGISNGYHQFRRSIKRMLNNQNPAVYPLSEQEIRQLLDGAGLRELRRYHVLLGVSEAVVVVAEKQ